VGARGAVRGSSIVVVAFAAGLIAASPSSTAPASAPGAAAVAAASVPAVGPVAAGGQSVRFNPVGMREPLAAPVPERVLPPVTTTALPGTAAARAIEFALAQRGLPYVWGGDGPLNGEDGFDCSGLTTAAYAHAGLALPRTAHTQFYAGPHVPADAELMPGDLVFYGVPERVHHVGLYLGGGQMVNAPRRGKPVQVAYVRYAGDDYLGATRPAAGVDATGSGLVATPDLPVRVPPVPSPAVPPAPEDFLAPPVPPAALAVPAPAATPPVYGPPAPVTPTPDALVPGPTTLGPIAPGPTVPGTTTPGATPGSTAPGSTTPGSTTPGSTVPGSTTPGSTTPGGSTPGGSTAPGAPVPGSAAPAPGSTAPVPGATAPGSTAPRPTTPRPAAPAATTPPRTTPPATTPPATTPPATTAPATTAPSPVITPVSAPAARAVARPASVGLPGGTITLSRAEQDANGLPAAPASASTGGLRWSPADGPRPARAVVSLHPGAPAPTTGATVTLRAADGTATTLTVRSSTTVDAATAGQRASARGDTTRLVLVRQDPSTGQTLVIIAE
jgi:cell wall-associated NlpC family hydrolase